MYVVTYLRRDQPPVRRKFALIMTACYDIRREMVDMNMKERRAIRVSEDLTRTDLTKYARELITEMMERETDA